MGKAIFTDLDFSSVNLGSVTLVDNIPVTGLSIVGESSVNGTTATYSVNYTPANTNQREVTWSIESGGEYASINSSTGVLTILEGALGSSVTIKAMSSSNSSVIATKSITVTYVAPGYTQYDYIQGDGNSYFNIGKLQSADIVEVIADVEDDGSDVFSTIIGSRNNSDLWMYIIHACPNHRFDVRAGGGAQYISYVATVDFVWNFGQRTLSLNGTPATYENKENLFFTSSISDYDFFVLAANNKNETASIANDNIKLREIKITRNGSIVADYIPAVDSNNTPCLIDIVSQNRFYNQGSGTLTVGNDL